MYRLLLLAVSFFACLTPCAAQKRPGATPAESLKVKKDFKVELLYSVPAAREGSWVNLCPDPKGRLIVSDQYGSLYRVTPPALGAPATDTKVEKLDLPIGEAQGLLFAFDSLYVVVNRGAKYESGLYRIPTLDGGDTFGKVELLKKINGGGEHGPHAVLLSPDGASLYIVCGNQTQVMQPLSSSRVPRLWGEDHLLKRLPDGNGFMRGVLGPGGCIYKVNPAGQNWELISTGYRNQYDAAFNRHGELLTYDADMEWDMNTPWYRPTRVNLATSGSEFGWRNGAGKWPAYYADSLPEVVNIGPGSPTGVCFGYGAKFPGKYQEAFFICDWSYGKLYAIHLTPDGSAYKGEIEEFISGTPLPLTDVIVNPKDAAMYFTIGGRRTQSGLYRVTYAGKETTSKPKPDERGKELRAVRRKLEVFHGVQDPKAIEVAWPELKNEDRYIRFAARTALEHQDPKLWQGKALEEQDPQAALTALLGLVRATSSDPFHRKPGSPTPEAGLRDRILKALEQLSWDGLTDGQRLELLRIHHVLFNRMGPPEGASRKRVVDRFNAVYPSSNRQQNAELCQLLVYLEAPGVAGKTMKLLAAALTQEEQLEYARALRVLKSGWTPPLRRDYFAWFQKAQGYRGGSSFKGFLRLMLEDALAPLTEAEKTDLLKQLLQTHASTSVAAITAPRPFVKNWRLDEVVTLTEKGFQLKRNFDRGRKLFGEANCFACHRFDNEGGSLGPDLTGVSGRFNVRDLLESVVDPSKVISDQYAAVNLTTVDGKVVTGRIVNLSGDGIIVMPNMLEPNALVTVDRKKLESLETSKISQMPTGLLDTLKEDEIVELMAYMLSGGNRNHKVYR